MDVLADADLSVVVVDVHVVAVAADVVDDVVADVVDDVDFEELVGGGADDAGDVAALFVVASPFCVEGVYLSTMVVFYVSLY